MIPQEWTEVLERIQDKFPGACIAGGAIRDTILEGNIKDVDIFIPVTVPHWNLFGADQAFIYDCQDTLKRMFVGYDIKLDESSVYGVASADNASRDLYSILKLQKAFLYDLILCTPAACDVSTFDINICQCKFDGKNLEYTEACIDGWLYSYIQVMNMNRSDRNERRVERLKHKYPEFSVREYDDSK